MKRYAIFIIVALLLAVGLSSACVPASEQNEVTLGALLPLSGSWSSAGESGRAAIEIALAEANEYFSSVGSRMALRLIIEDSGTDPQLALEKLKVLAEKRVRIVIGPQTSAEIEAVKSYADEKGLILLSDSTAPSLAIADNIFRYCLNDTHQAEAISRLMWEEGIRAVIPVWRGDAWGDGLKQATKTSFDALGGRVLDGVRYLPDTVDFSEVLASLSSRLDQAVASYGADRVGVQLIAFDEVVSIFGQAQDYSALSAVKWYGCDTTALNQKIIDSPQAAKFAATVGFPSPIYSGTSTEKYNRVIAEIEVKTHRRADSYAVAAYDAVWIVAQTYLATGLTEDLDILKRALKQTTETYFGATGWAALDEVGDRRFGDYDFWAVREEAGSLQWKRVARYQTEPGFPARLATDLVFPS